MTIHKTEHEFVLKASIGELMVALNGIVTAGVTAVKNGADTKADPVASLGVEAAMLAYDIRSDLSFGRMSGAKAADKITEFLKSSRELLVENKSLVLSFPKGGLGGTVEDVVSHIDQIMMREEIGGERPPVKIVNGSLQDTFKAAYTPKASKEQAAEPAFEGEPEENLIPAKPRGRGGRPKKSASYAAPASVLA